MVVVETPGPPEATSHVPPASQKSQVLSLFRTAKQVEVEEFQRETASQIQLITDSPISQYDTQFIPSSLKIEEVSEAEDRRQEIFISPQKSPKSVIGYTSFTIGGSPILHRTSTIPTEKPGQLSTSCLLLKCFILLSFRNF